MRADASRSCADYLAGISRPPAGAAAWCRAGRSFGWRSTLPDNAEFAELRIFWVRQGDPAHPAVLLVHGYPTSSHDFVRLAADLSRDHCVYALDLPGHGFSDKPRNGYRYSLVDDARLVDHFVREVAGLEELPLVTHDRGDSVGLALLQLLESLPQPAYTIRHHVITNGNVYLPLARLTLAQRLLLRPVTGPALSALLTGTRFAKGLVRATVSSDLSADELASLAAILDYQGGTRVQHAVIQYLHERHAHELEWLDLLRRSEIPTTLVWGELDRVAPVAVADHVWDTCLRDRPDTRYWRLPRADHYLQLDQPDVLAALVRSPAEATTGAQRVG